MGRPVDGAELTATSPQVRLQQMIAGYVVSQAVYAVAKLGIPDLLADGSLTADELAAGSGAHAPTLFRFLRALVGVDVLRQEPGDRFALGPLGHLLRSGVPGSLRSYAIHANEESYRAWGEAVESVRSGRPGFEIAFGTGFYDYLAAHPESDTVWNDSMTETERAWTIDPGLVDAYDWRDIGSVVDVGGGQGALLAAILIAAPWVTGTLFDLPSVVAGAGALLRSAGVADRCRVVGGDAFAGVPEGADVYVLSRVLFNWDDDQAARLLRNCRQAMGDSGRVLIVEPVMAGNAGTAGLIDLNVFMICGGRTRDHAELDALLGRADLQFSRLVPTRAAWHIIEARPQGTT